VERKRNLATGQASHISRNEIPVVRESAFHLGKDGKYKPPSISGYAREGRKNPLGHSREPSAMALKGYNESKKFFAA
jgi:hypothetical protein